MIMSQKSGFVGSPDGFEKEPIIFEKTFESSLFIFVRFGKGHLAGIHIFWI